VQAEASNPMPAAFRFSVPQLHARYLLGVSSECLDDIGLPHAEGKYRECDLVRMLQVRQHLAIATDTYH
jgi:hypothetical protein